MILFKLHLKVSPAKKEEVISIFDSLVGPISVQPGCIRINLYSDIKQNDDFVLLEEWTSRDEIVKHIRSAEFLKILAIMDLASESPEIFFNTVTSIEGFELIEKIKEKMANVS